MDFFPVFLDKLIFQCYNQLKALIKGRAINIMKIHQQFYVNFFFLNKIFRILEMKWKIYDFFFNCDN